MKRTEKLRNWLDNQLVKESAGYCFPPVSKIAGSFGVSEITVRRTIREYAAAGKLETIRGKGTYIPSIKSRVSIPPARDKKSAAEELADTIRESIARGEYKKGDALPQLTYLSLKFKLSYQTVVKAFQLLVASEQIIKTGKTFRVGTFRDNTAPGANREICILNHISDDFSDVYTSNMRFAYRKMENELNLHGFRISYAGTSRMEELFRTWQEEESLPHALLLTGLMDNDRHPPIDRLRRCLSGLTGHLPRVLIDSSSLRMGKNPIQAPHIIMARGHVTTASVRALSDYLAEKRYRQAAVFMDVASESWVVSGDYFAPYRMAWELYDRRNTMDLRFIVLPRLTDRFNIQLLRRRNIPSRINNNARRKMGPAERQYAKKLDRITYITSSYDRWYDRAYTPGTIWIFTSDEHAAAALKWAESKGIRVPEDLSVIGLDHKPEYFHLGLSYCGPDWDTIGYQMAHALIGDMPVARTGKGFLRTRADIFTKRTSR